MSGAALPGYLVAVQVNADPGWGAIQDDHEIPITQNKLGFVVLHPTPAAATRIELRFRGTTEQRIMAALCAMTWIASLFALWGRRFRLPTAGSIKGWQAEEPAPPTACIRKRPA
jgi:hypothetical protein